MAFLPVSFPIGQKHLRRAIAGRVFAFMESLMTGSNNNDETGAGQGPIVIEASWAPKDPRDRLYDKDATKAERTMSLIRVIAAFHPVLNFFLLISDALRRLPAPWLAVLGLLVVGAVAAFFFNW
jgi:hypothetical protein